MKIAFKHCPLCRALDFRPFREDSIRQHALWHPSLPTTITWVRCRACSHVFTETFWSEKAMEIIFNQAHGFQTPGSNPEVGRVHAARLIEDHRYCEEPWLDVGFGAGDLILTAMEYGIEVHGIDARQKFVNELSKLGVQTISCTTIDKYVPYNKFRTILMLDVLEHIPYPIHTLYRVHEMLESGGHLILSMPNIDAPIWDMIEPNPYWFEIEHFHNFGRKRLEDFLIEHSFEPISYSISHRYRACMEITARKV